MRRFATPLVALFIALPAAAEGPLAQLQAAAGAVAAEPVVTRAPLAPPVARPGPRRQPGRDDGRELAATACAEAAFEADKQACMRIVSRAYYFAAAAVEVCRQVNFSGEMPGCIGAIADKTFLRAEIEQCGRESFGSHIIACFQRSGRSNERGRDDDAYVRRQLWRLRSLLRDGRYRDAERELDELIDALEP